MNKKAPRKLRDIGRAALKADNIDDGFGFFADRKREATDIAKMKGHALTKFVTRTYTESIADAYCEHCNRLAVVNIDPKFGMPMVYGHALKEDCQ